MKHGEPVRCMAARPDGKAVATVTADGEVWLWVPRRPARSRTPGAMGPATISRSRSIRPGQYWSPRRVDGTLRLWNGSTLEPIGPVITMNAWIRCLAISPDGGSLAAGDQNGRLGFWDAPRGSPLVPWSSASGFVVGPRL